MIQDPIKKSSKKLITHVVIAYLELQSVSARYLQPQQVESLIGDASNRLSWLKQLRMKYTNATATNWYVSMCCL